ncbi:Rid family hydrolase, partial [Pseudomonas sp. SIMBA_077]
MGKRDVVFAPGRRALYERNRYSPAVRAGGLLFVSGQVGSREDGTPEPDLQEQVRLAFRNLNAILHAAGCTFDDVVDVTVFM